MFAKADLDDDGFVTSDDFYNMMTHRVYWDSIKWFNLYNYLFDFFINHIFFRIQILWIFFIIFRMFVISWEIDD